MFPFLKYFLLNTLSLIFGGRPPKGKVFLIPPYLERALEGFCAVPFFNSFLIFKKIILTSLPAWEVPVCEAMPGLSESVRGHFADFEVSK